MPSQPRKPTSSKLPRPGWAVYLRTSSDEKQKPELSRARQRFTIKSNVLERSDLPMIEEYVDVFTGKTPKRDGYQKLLRDARGGKFSHVIVERADRFGRNDTEALRAIDELHDFGVAVRFANSPDLDPMDPDGRVMVALMFSLARRETSLLGIRVKGGLRAKRESGGYCGHAPDGYKNVERRTEIARKHDLGRFTHRIELDPARAIVWREAWEMLLEERWTLKEIAAKLHERGYRYQSGRAFLEVLPSGKIRANVNTMSDIFHNWTYAGWIVSEANQIPPKTLRGNWEPLVSTEDFERGLAILDKRNHHPVPKRKRSYLLQGIIYFDDPHHGLVKLTGSTPNAGRSGGGTSYYCVSSSDRNFLCSVIEVQIPEKLHDIQVDPELSPIIRAYYTHDLAQTLGSGQPQERKRLANTLKAVDEEENRASRLMASGKISEEVWESLWAEWQDRRQRLRAGLEMLDKEEKCHIDNLETALQIIEKAGALYNALSYSERKALLQHMVERVIVNRKGRIRLELRTPFAYLQDLMQKAERQRGASERETKSSGPRAAGCSTSILSSCKDRIRTFRVVITEILTTFPLCKTRLQNIVDTLRKW